MKLVACDKNVLNLSGYALGENQRIVLEFRESGLDCAEVTGYTQKSATSCAASLTKTIQGLHANNIKAITRKGHVYLVRIKP